MPIRSSSRSALAPLAALVLAIVVCEAPVAARLTFEQPGFREETIAANLPFATAIAFDHRGRIFIALKSGVVRVWSEGELLAAPFIDLSTQVNDVFDRGLLGLALHPDFPSAPYVYLLFTRDPPGVPPDGSGGRASRLIRVTASAASDFTLAAPGMETAQVPACLLDPPPEGCPGHTVLLGRNSLRPFLGDVIDGRNTARASCMAGGSMGDLPLLLPADDPNQPYPDGTARPIEDCLPVDERTHTIGTVAFGLDGSLFVSAGDGANFGEADPRALRVQMLDSAAGKILRIDADTGSGLADNPHFDPRCPDCVRSKVWARGLRNPFRFAIDPNSGEPVIGDVGWNSWEEVNRGRGANFGWPCYEGGPRTGLESVDNVSLPQSSFVASPATAVACAQLLARGPEAVVAPAFAYGHEGDGFGGEGGASIAASTFYTGTTYPPAFRGALFLSDFNRRWIRVLRFDGGEATEIIDFARESDAGIVQLVPGPGGDLHAVVFSGRGSEVRRIGYTPGGNTPPAAVVSAAPIAGAAPLTVSFVGTGSRDAEGQPLVFAWDFGDGNVSSEPDPEHTYAEPGEYTVVLTVTEATPPFATGEARRRIFSGTTPPTARVHAPSPGTTYRIGDRVEYSGEGTVDGVAATAPQLEWEMRLLHNQHEHFTALPGGPRGSFVVEEHGDATSIEICLTVEQEPDLAATDCVGLLPDTSSVRVGTEPPGLSVVYEDEGILLQAPATVHPVVGSVQRFTVPFVQEFLSFAGWADGVAEPSRSVPIGPVPVDLTATFTNRPPLAVANLVPTGGPAPLAVAASAAGSSDPEAGPLAYRWDFAGEATAATSRAAHTFALPGTYRVALDVADPRGAVRRAEVAVTVESAACACGEADADGDTDGVCDRLDVCDGGVRVDDVRASFFGLVAPRTRGLHLRARLAGDVDADRFADAGLSLRLRDACGNALVDARFPPGAAWRLTRRGAVWRGEHESLGRVRLHVAADRSGDGVWLRLRARRMPAAWDPSAVPQLIDLRWGPGTKECGERGLGAERSGRTCRIVAQRSAMRCRATSELDERARR